MTRAWMLAALLMGGCELTASVKYQCDLGPGHLVGAELAVSRSADR